MVYRLCINKKDGFKEPQVINILQMVQGSGMWCKIPHKICTYINLRSTPVVFQVEVYAIAAAANILAQLDVRNQTVNQLTNSQTAFRVLDSIKIRSGIV